MVAWLLAHQGGWDEILMVVGPLALLWFLLRKAKARADAMAAPDQPEGPDVGSEAGPDLNPPATPTPPAN
jgi:hypothetical protein